MKKAAKPSQWKCSECSAPWDACGEGQCAGIHGACGGLVCECMGVDTKPGHGESQDDACPNAVCGHCRWEGRVPPLPKKLEAWEKKALAAGWKPPKGWGA
jgi:hypothetical protein